MANPTRRRRDRRVSVFSRRIEAIQPPSDRLQRLVLHVSVFSRRIEAIQLDFGLSEVDAEIVSVFSRRIEAIQHAHLS